MPRAFRPSILTANDLLTGAVVYLSRDGSWTRDIAAARLLEDEARAGAALAAAEAMHGEIVAPFLAPVDPATLSPLATREMIRTHGPFTLPRARKAGTRKPTRQQEPHHVSA